MVLKQEGEKLTGTVGNQPLDGTITGGEVAFTVGNRSATGTLAGGQLAGEVAQGPAASRDKRSPSPRRSSTDC
jgi:hypothetical protein